MAAKTLQTQNLDRHNKKHKWWLVFCFSLLALPALACGRFEPLPEAELVSAAPTATATATRWIATMQPVTSPTPAATATLTPTVAATGPALRVGESARVVAPQGVNIREAASAKAKRTGRFGTGIKVVIQDGPIDADNFRWWKVADSSGKSGWIAQGDAQTVWLSPQLGDPRPVDRAVRLSDTVIITADGVALRAFSGNDATLLREMPRGTKLSLVEGPVDVDGRRWWHVKNEKYDGWAAETAGQLRLLSPLE